MRVHRRCDKRPRGRTTERTELLNERNCTTPVLRIGWPNEFVEHGREDQLRAKHRLTPEAMAETILNHPAAK